LGLITRGAGEFLGDGVPGVRDGFGDCPGVAGGGGDLVAAAESLTGDLQTEAT
jgi:hypothetical protein